ncbi:MAG TPA: hypothetical protein VJ654_12770 [Noviherbaspirillum sp.]|nr:hypothetical protein [Noviherbaspirillum sp.]
MSVAAVPTRDEAPRTKLFMRSGNWVNLYDPLAQDIVLEDWVVGASRAARYGGQTKGDYAYNVLQHSSLVENILTDMVMPNALPAYRLAALCHDLHEGGGLGDIVTPYGKLFARAGLTEVKSRIDHALFESIGIAHPLSPEVKAAIKKADVIAAVTEAVQLMDWPERLARRDVGEGYEGPLWTKPIEILDERASRAEWWGKFRELHDLVKKQEHTMPEGCRLAGSDATGRILRIEGEFAVQSAGRGAIVAHELRKLTEETRAAVIQAVGTDAVLRIRNGKIAESEISRER